MMLLGCQNILEPVSLYGNSGQTMPDDQEEFLISTLPLTFSSTKKANQDPYLRKLMRSGSGSQANVIYETNFLQSKLPPMLNKAQYTIGIGDELSFSLQSEFIENELKLPPQSSKTEYMLGVGDVLKFIQQNEISEKTLIPSNGIVKLVQETTGVVGTNGNILLLGLGNINVGTQSLEDVRNLVRNTLIRNGLAPNFQLEIIEFNSKKAYVTTSKGASQIIKINSQPPTLHEVITGFGVSYSNGNHAIISLTRDSREFRITAKQLSDSNTNDIYIQDKDNIVIEFLSDEISSNVSVVDSNGNILLPIVGSLKAENKRLSELQKEISSVLINKGLRADFQLELSLFNSKKAYFVSKDKTDLVSLTDKNITLRELALSNNITLSDSTGLQVFTLIRNGKKYQLTREQLLNPNNQDIWIQDGDHIEKEVLIYKPGQVFALSGTGNARIIPIRPSARETLADILFLQNGALTNSFAKRSEVYLLRGHNPLNAYHLDAQNVSRLLVAAQMELRPNDIIFVAERPIISFARTLSELSPLRSLLRDIRDENLP